LKTAPETNVGANFQILEPDGLYKNVVCRRARFFARDRFSLIKTGTKVMNVDGV